MPKTYEARGCLDTRAVDRQIIDSTYDDFYKLSHLDGLYQNIAWEEQAAKEMWGVTSGPAPKPDDRKEEIRRALLAPSIPASMRPRG